MSFIEGLYGDAAVIVLCSVLFANEAGVPMPTNGELILIAGGILVGTGAVDAWLLVPMAIVASAGGAFVGYSWARLVGESGLLAVAERVGQGRRLARVSARLGRASPLRIALYRLTPGFRTYTSLVAGAVGVSRFRFLAGIGPLIVLWVIAYTALGALVGAPASRYLNHLQNLVLQGGLLIGVGVGAYLALRRVPAGGRAALARLPVRLRVTLAVAVDVALIATVVVGVVAIVRGLLAIANSLLPLANFSWWVELLAIVLVIAIFYSIATRRGLKATAGETLFDASYLTYVRLNPLVRAIPDKEGAPPDELVRASQALRCLADPSRLQVARLMLQRDVSPTDVSSSLALSGAHAREVLRELEEAGIVVGQEDGMDRRYTIANVHVRVGLAELLTHLSSD